MGKSQDLSDFQRGMVVGARRSGLSVTETATLLGFSRTTVSRVYREWSTMEKTSSQRQCCGRKKLVDERGQRRMKRIVHSTRRATVSQLTAEYNSGVERRISERTTRRTLSRMGYRSRRACRAPAGGDTRDSSAVETQKSGGSQRHQVVSVALAPPTESAQQPRSPLPCTV